MLKAGVGISTNRDPQAAARAAARTALKRAGLDRCDLVIVAATPSYDLTSLLGGVRGVALDAQLVGCTVAGVAGPKMRDDLGHSVGIMALQSRALRFTTVAVSAVGHSPTQLAQDLARALGRLPADVVGLLLFADGFLVDFPAVAAPLLVALGRSIPLLGGMATCTERNSNTHQFHQDSVMTGGVVGVLICGPGKLRTYVSGGLTPLGRTFQVSRAEGHLLYELDGQNVLGLLEAYLGEELLRSPGVPVVDLGFCVESQGLTNEAPAWEMRLIQTVDSRVGCIRLPTPITPGTRVRLAWRESRAISEGLEDVQRRLSLDYADVSPWAVLHIESVARVRHLFTDSEKSTMLAALQGCLPSDTPWLGLYGLAELEGAGADRSGYKNGTAVVGVLSA